MDEAPVLAGGMKLTRPVWETAKLEGVPGAVVAVKTIGTDAGEVLLEFWARTRTCNQTLSIIN